MGYFLIFSPITWTTSPREPNGVIDASRYPIANLCIGDVATRKGFGIAFYGNGIVNFEYLGDGFETYLKFGSFVFLDRKITVLPYQTGRSGDR